jgi:ATP-dependent Clp protease ATP-binding subunit ClpX
MSETNIVVCSFCGKDKQDTNILIAGSHAHICDLCIEQAHNIVKGDSNTKFVRR